MRVVDNVPQPQLLESVRIFINLIYFPLFSCQTDFGSSIETGSNERWTSGLRKGDPSLATGLTAVGKLSVLVKGVLRSIYTYD